MSSDSTRAQPMSPNAEQAIPDQVLDGFHVAVASWFRDVFSAPTMAQSTAWPAILRGESTLVCAPTGSGKTLTAFLASIDRLMFAPHRGICRVLYISPLKALAVDVERNLRAPVVGIRNAAINMGLDVEPPTFFIRTGDTSSSERRSFSRTPSEILITTPESLFLMLTSRARAALENVETVIIDEIHAVVGTKRGAHLALSLERLESLAGRTLQRIGLSATQRPLEEVARFLGGGTREGDVWTPRPVTIIHTREQKKLDLLVEVPVEDMARLGEPVDIPSGAAAQPETRHSIWPSIHPRLLELIRSHRSTLIFVNSRRLAERLAGALNELGETTLAYAHHGSMSRARRTEIEDMLKTGKLPALVATSSLELGIDMGAIDLVIQIESPATIASALQRIGRAGHQVGARSRGIIFPKYRGDLVACAAITSAMKRGQVEPVRFPRNPLDVLAQQIVATIAMDEMTSAELYTLVTRAASYAELSRGAFDGILDVMTGVYPSDDFAELRPRLTWNRVTDLLAPRRGAARVAIANAGTIPDRGLYGVFLPGADGKTTRVGELDEEMVFESREGETFVLGASTWRIEEITFDRIIVSPAPGEPGKMPFWKGESAGRSAELGREIGQLLRQIVQSSREDAKSQLRRDHDLDELAAENLVQYIDDQRNEAEIPTDRTIVIERYRDELGDWRICVLSPFGGRVHAPWAIAVVGTIQDRMGLEVESMWTDDGFVIRIPDIEESPDPELFLPDPDELRDLIVRHLANTALFAARFRENAARALLLPRKRPGVRTPLWQQRKRASDLLRAASDFHSFPLILETYRECLTDVFDLGSLSEILREIRSRAISVSVVDTTRPSPFAGAILFRYVANFIYDGDAPLAERRAQALSIDPAQLRELIGEVELRELLDPNVLSELEHQLQFLAPQAAAASQDDLHDLLLRLGDLSRPELEQRIAGASWSGFLDPLLKQQRVIPVRIRGEERLIPAEYASRYRDALGIPLPSGLPDRMLESDRDPLADLVMRYARTHGPFELRALKTRYGFTRGAIEPLLENLARKGRLVEGELSPFGLEREWCDADVMKTIRRRSLAKLRSEVEPAEQEVFVRFLQDWQGIARPSGGLDALLDAVEKLEGFPLPVSILETEIFPARVADFRSSELDTLAAAGEITWVGLEPLGHNDGRVALFLTDHLPVFSPRPEAELPADESAVVDILSENGPSFFADIHARAGHGYPGELLEILWRLVWKSVVRNDSFHPLRSLLGSGRERRRSRSTSFRSRRQGLRGSEGRWSLVPPPSATAEERSLARATQLLQRYGIVTRDTAAFELEGGFSGIYPTFRSLEEAGRLRRGLFVDGLGGSQFAQPGAIERLRSFRGATERSKQTSVISSTDPANPFGSALRWPDTSDSRRPSRSVGTRVVIIDGHLAAWIARGSRHIITWLPDQEPEQTRIGSRLAEALEPENRSRRAAFIETIDGTAPAEHPFGERLVHDFGWTSTSLGIQKRHSGRA
ncbi:MAG: DEAD/DEAH box helicase [Acidobacteria bacterium]|nr:DEAD/DEAH box helicase [Acidobacteriota bacterium]